MDRYEKWRVTAPKSRQIFNICGLINELPKEKGGGKIKLLLTDAALISSNNVAYFLCLEGLTEGFD